MTVPADPALSSPPRFGSLEAWLFDPLPVFALWLDSQELEESTKKVKEFMWGKWCRFLAERAIPLNVVESEHLSDFFKKEKVAKAQKQRYVRLIERVYAQLIFLGLSIENPGTQAVFAKLGTGQNDPTVFLEEEEIEKLKKVIDDRMAVGIGAGKIEEKEEKKRKGRKKKLWVLARDAALASVMVGGGATVYGAGHCSVSCTNKGEGSISLPRKGGLDYDAPLTPHAHATLNAWIRYLGTRHNPSGLLFPSDLDSRINPETVIKNPGMSPSSIFRAVRGVLADAGITGARACGQTLRNTYAGTLIDRGFDDSQIGEALGFYDPLSAVRLRANWRNSHPE